MSDTHDHFGELDLDLEPVAEPEAEPEEPLRAFVVTRRTPRGISIVGDYESEEEAARVLAVMEKSVRRRTKHPRARRAEIARLRVFAAGELPEGAYRSAPWREHVEGLLETEASEAELKKERAAAEKAARSTTPPSPAQQQQENN